MEGANCITPYLLTLPYVGFSPNNPHREEGTRIDPLVSVPIEAADINALTATAEPPLEPPDILLISHGFFEDP